VAALSLCDGRLPARELAARLVADPAVPLASADEVYGLLDALCKSRVLLWELEVPLELHPEATLAELLARIEPADLRTAALAKLAELTQARDRAALAAGDPAALNRALRELETTFTRLTGAAPSHHHGQAYGARGLVYEDCLRDIDVELGPALTTHLGPPLGLVLTSARWAAGEMSHRLESALRPLYAELRRQTGQEAVDGYAFYNLALSRLLLRRGRQDWATSVERDFQARWSAVLGPLPAGARRVRFTAAELAERCQAQFGAARPTWTLTRYFSPDVMIAAAGDAAFRRGEFDLVLGEIHAGNTLLWSCFLSQQPHLEEIRRALEEDTGTELVVLPQMLKASWTQRLNLGLTLPHWYRFQFADEPPGGSEMQRVPAGALVVEEIGEGLRARTRDGRVTFSVVDLFSSYLTVECSALIGAMLAPERHLPRVQIDRVTVARERWGFAADELEFAALPEGGERFLALRRWAREFGLPRFSFYKLSTERKPCFLDLDSPVSGDIFAHQVRAGRQADAAARVGVSEMLPGLDEAWLRDADGNLYTSELRLAALREERNGGPC
jgi:Lantibiotic dehydratase, N terminus